MTQTEILDRAVDHLARRSLRPTQARRVVLEALAAAEGPRSAAQIDELLERAIPVSSLYRTLASLEGAEILVKYRDAEGVARYELAESITGDHHHHFVCVRCGRTVDVAISHDFEHTVAELIETIARQGDYIVTGHRIELEGICPQCRAQR